MEPIVFRFIVAALLVGFVLHRGFYTRAVRHPAATVRERPVPGLAARFAPILALPALLATGIYVFAPARMAFAALPVPNALRWLGVAVALGGFALLQWAQHSLGRNWSDEPRLVERQVLVVGGPYRWVRHPIYAAFLLILGALLPISANAVVGGLWLALTALDIAQRIRTEEAMLSDRFGDGYQAYVQRTGRLLPRLGR